MSYIENPKTKGSGIVCAIPQKGRCPHGCADCFFQSGRSYLEPLEKHTPNMPHPDKVYSKVVRVNDGNDSNNDRDLVLHETKDYPWRFYNTSCPDDLEGYGAPVVLTVNPGEMTDVKAYDPGCLQYPVMRVRKNIMFVRVRTNTWNLRVVNFAVKYWTAIEVPVVLTFMRYWNLGSPEFALWMEQSDDYTYRLGTTNRYWRITTKAWRRIMQRYEDNPLVHSCGTEGISTKCKHCGNCLREYYATMERMLDNNE